MNITPVQTIWKIRKPSQSAWSVRKSCLQQKLLDWWQWTFTSGVITSLWCQQCSHCTVIRITALSETILWSSCWIVYDYRGICLKISAYCSSISRCLRLSSTPSSEAEILPTPKPAKTCRHPSPGYKQPINEKKQIINSRCEPLATKFVTSSLRAAPKKTKQSSTCVAMQQFSNI